MTVDEPVCGAIKVYPSSQTEMMQRGLPAVWAGVTVHCDDPVHECAEEDVVHSGPVFVGDAYQGVSYWGPGVRPHC